MGTLDEVSSMRHDGRTDEEILSSLKNRGLSEKEISSVMTQTRIKDAVSGYESMVEENAPAPSPTGMQQSSASVKEYGEMSPSLMSPDANGRRQQTSTQIQQPSEQSDDQNYQTEQPYAEAPQAYADYNYQQYPTSGIGSDLIAEIADQVVTEKLSPLISGIDKMMDLRSAVESQLKYLDERLKRIEKIIDRLQLSLLQRVGEYVSNVEEIKQEMAETQKTFKSLIDKR